MYPSRHLQLYANLAGQFESASGYFYRHTFVKMLGDHTFSQQRNLCCFLMTNDSCYVDRVGFWCG